MWSRLCLQAGGRLPRPGSPAHRSLARCMAARWPATGKATPGHVRYLSTGVEAPSSSSMCGCMRTEFMGCSAWDRIIVVAVVSSLICYLGELIKTTTPSPLLPFPLVWCHFAITLPPVRTPRPHIPNAHQPRLKHFCPRTQRPRMRWKSIPTCSSIAKRSRSGSSMFLMDTRFSLRCQSL